MHVIDLVEDFVEISSLVYLSGIYSIVLRLLLCTLVTKFDHHLLIQYNEGPGFCPGYRILSLVLVGIDFTPRNLLDVIQ